MKFNYPFLLSGLLLGTPTAFAQKSEDVPATPIHSPAYHPAGMVDRDGNRTVLVYCTPTFTTGTGDGDFIDGVELGTLVNPASGASPTPYYTDYSFSQSFFPGIGVRLSAGSSYNMTITAGSYVPIAPAFEAYVAWIDFDQDGAFDMATEEVAYAQTTAAYQSAIVNFSVPFDALAGYTTMRVMNVFNTLVIDPCGSYAYGETEDYVVLIENGTCIPLYDYGTLDGDYLSEVVCDDLNAVNPAGGNVSPYSDFFMLGTQFARGGSHSITLTSGDYTGVEWLGAWADWNFDGDWDDSGEQLGLTSVTGANQSTTFNFSVPTNALVGYTKLRARAIYAGSGATACSDAGFGETNDFTVSIVDGVFTCLPIQGWGSVAGDGFADVTLDGLTYLGSAVWPYYQWSADVFRFDRGTSHTIDITNGGWAGERFQAYMDMNDDGDLTDAGEDFGYVQASAAGQALGLVFTIPASCPPGQHTLRLRAFDPVNFPPADACSNHGYGETFDFHIAVEDPAGPCIPHMAYWTTDGDFINSVSLNGMSNTNTGGAFEAAYHDYTAMGPTLDVGSNYTLTVQGGDYAGDYYLAWIDYNADNDFDDAGEAIGNVVIGTSLGYGDINFTVPSATLGDKRLRVRSRLSADVNACADAGFGETEDYTVTLQTGTGLAELGATAASVVPQPAIGAAELRTGSALNGASYTLIDATGRAVANGRILSERTLVNMASMTPGAYTLMITSEVSVGTLRFVWEQR